MKTFLIAVAALATLSGSALAAPVHKAVASKPVAKNIVLTCPVTGNKIASVKDAVGHTTYKGKTYYFCCPECKPMFDKNPAKYIQRAAHGQYQKM